MNNGVEIVMQLGGSIIFAIFFALFYKKIFKKKISRYWLTLVASMIGLIFSISSDFSIISTIILFFIGLPIYYCSLTEENNLLKQAYKIKLSGTFKFIVTALLVSVTVYFINYGYSLK